MNNFRRITQLVLSGYLVLLFTITPFSAYAQTNQQGDISDIKKELNQNSEQTNLVTYSGVQSSIEAYLCTPSPSSDGKALENCINKLFRVGVVVGGLIMVFLVVAAGYMYIVGNEGGKKSAKDMLYAALTGMAVLLGGFILLKFINPNLVLIKPIQPPIFSASEIPSCEDIGYEDDCLLPSGQIASGGSGAFGAKIACPAGKIVSAKGLGLPTKQADEKICEPFGKKLLGLKTSLAGINWYITDTIGSGHLSNCHKPDNAYSGTCADIGISEKSTENWNKVCKAILALGEVQPVNEADGKASDCPKYGTYSTTTGAHIHSNWRTGGGGGTTATSGATGARPYCRTILGFLCEHPSGYENTSNYPGYPDKAATSSSDAEVQANIAKVLAAVNALQKKHSNIKILQLYRPHEYGAHMRAVFEAGALTFGGMTEDQVKKRGFYCDGTIQYVKKSDVANLSPEAKAYIQKHWTAHSMSTAASYDTTCLSDHGFGYGVDISNATSDAVESDAEAVGLCHNLPGDTNHYVLKDKNRNNKGCNW